MLNKFFEMLAVCEDKVTYGPKSVAKALEDNAVETLLLSDKLFRAKNIEQRKFYVKMYEQATRDKLEVVLFGATNAAAQRLNGLTGVAAILRYEMAELQDVEESSSEDDESSDEEKEVVEQIDTQSKSSKKQQMSDDEEDSDEYGEG